MYRKSFIPRKLSPKLVAEMRQAFFSGAATIWTLFLAISEMDTDQALAKLDDLYAEIVDFGELLDEQYLGPGLGDKH